MVAVSLESTQQLCSKVSAMNGGTQRYQGMWTVELLPFQAPLPFSCSAFPVGQFSVCAQLENWLALVLGWRREVDVAARRWAVLPVTPSLQIEQLLPNMLDENSFQDPQFEADH